LIRDTVAMALDPFGILCSSPYHSPGTPID